MKIQEKISNWGPIKSRTEEDLKKIAKDLYNDLIFTDRHAGNNLTSSFMVLLFMGPKQPSTPKYPNKSDSVENERDNALYDVLQRDIDQKKYMEDMLTYEEDYKDFKEKQLTSIGLVYEYLTEAGPTSVNGCPVFFSLRLLNKVDTEKMFEYYNQYKEIREKADNF